MHPIERLRSVARASGAPGSAVVRESAAALASIADDHHTLVMACQRLLHDHPEQGAVVTLAARLLTALDPRAEAWQIVDETDDDAVAGSLADSLGEGADVVVFGWPESAAPALVRRADVVARVVDVDDGPGLVRALHRRGCDAVDVPLAGAAAAIDSADVVLIEALAIGATEALVTAGARAGAAAAGHSRRPVWLLAGWGRVLPGALWAPLIARLPGDQPWDRNVETLPLDLVDRIVRAGGPEPVASVLQRPDCPVAHELT